MRAIGLTFAFVAILAGTADLKVRTTVQLPGRPCQACARSEPRPATSRTRSTPSIRRNRRGPRSPNGSPKCAAEAIARGLREEIVDEALATVDEPLPVVLERDRAQAETVLPLETYIARQTRTSIVRNGRQMAVRHADLLEARRRALRRAAARDHGHLGHRVELRPVHAVSARPSAALATLAWDPRRSTLFRSELFSALEILDRG